MPDAAHIALLSPCGWGNLGDAAIVSSLIHGIRRRVPRARIVGLTLNPADTSRRHGIPAFTCTGFSRPHYGVAEPRAGTDVAGDAGDTAAGDDRGAGRRGLRAWVRQAALAVPATRAAWDLASMVRADLRHRRASATGTGGLDLLVVAGGGQLDEFWGGPLGHPYVLWRWTHHARRVGARAVVLSVGTGTLPTALGRYFVRATLAAADYVSFRDDGSRAMLGPDSPAASAPTVPDLAYAVPLPPARPRSATAAGGGGRALIALSPIAYGDPRVWPASDPARYRRHVATMASLAALLLADGNDVVLYATDGPDQRTVDDVRAEVTAAAGGSGAQPPGGGRLEVRTVGDVPELLELYAAADAVVAARLHGLLLAHVAGAPTLALSYERKVETLMRDMGQQDLCLPIDDFQPDVGHGRMRALLARRSEVTAAVRRRVEELRAAVESQYDRVFGEMKPS